MIVFCSSKVTNKTEGGRQRGEKVGVGETTRECAECSRHKPNNQKAEAR